MNGVFFVVAFIAGVVVGVTLCVINGLKNSPTRKLRARLDYINKTYKILAGYTAGVGNYTFISTDGGATWHTAERAELGYRIVSKADPQQIQRVLGMRTFIDLAAGRGLDITDPATLGIMKDAGFTVERRGSND